MRKSIVRSALAALAMASALTWSATAGAQWLKYPTAGVPKTADGKPNLSAPNAASSRRQAGLLGHLAHGQRHCAPRRRIPSR